MKNIWDIMEKISWSEVFSFLGICGLVVRFFQKRKNEKRERQDFDICMRKVRQEIVKILLTCQVDTNNRTSLKGWVQRHLTSIKIPDQIKTGNFPDWLKNKREKLQDICTLLEEHNEFIRLVPLNETIPLHLMPNTHNGRIAKLLQLTAEYEEK